MSVKMLVINDVHLSASPPIGCRPAYVQDVMSMLVEARNHVINNDVAITVFTGDFWHHKRNVPYWIVNWAIELLRDWPGRKLAIVGNHDLSEEGLASVPRQPIGVLFAAEVLEWMQEDVRHNALLHDEQATLTIQFSPANYVDSIDGNDGENTDASHYTATKRATSDWLVKVAHGMLAAPGKTYPFAYTPMQTVVAAAPDIDLVVYGHPHYDLGVVTVGDTVFASLGSLGRVARTNENRTRTMKLLEVTFHKDVMDFSDVVLKSALPADELFLEQKQDGAELTDGMVRFARSMQSLLQLESARLDDVLATIPGAGENAEAKRRLVQYLQKAGM